jgi:hypothetical protein
MRTANVVKGALRATTSAALGAAFLSTSGLALASPTYPAAIATDLGLSKAPACTICHDTASGGTGTANKAFAKAMMAAGLTGGSNTDALKAALQKLEADGTDSNGDGVPDIQELKQGKDPNQVAGQGGGPSPAAPELTYGCVAEIAPQRSLGRGAWLPIALVGGVVIAIGARRRRLRAALVPIAGAGLLAAACYQTSFVSSTVCSSGLEWTGGEDNGAPIMNPGERCIECHKERGGPGFTIAGTVFDQAKEADSCIGTRTPVKVVITGADGKSISIETNEAGNFYSRESVAMPYKAMVVSGTKKNVMSHAPKTGDCNSCHTADGAEGAPGRILPP